jgi:hypothetical protein
MEFSSESFDADASETLSQTHSFNDILNHPSTPSTPSPPSPVINLPLDNTQQPSDFSCECL